jgi:hypothetical protein
VDIENWNLIACLVKMKKSHDNTSICIDRIKSYDMSVNRK